MKMLIRLIISIIIIFSFNQLFSTCTICPAEKEFSSILLNGSWIQSNETSLNCTQILTFIDMENIRQVFPKNNDTIVYHYSMNLSELELLNDNNEVAAKYKIDFIDKLNEVMITRVDSANDKSHNFNSFVGKWKRYQ
jgi:hypothetical protein